MHASSTSCMLQCKGENCLFFFIKDMIFWGFFRPLSLCLWLITFQGGFAVSILIIVCILIFELQYVGASWDELKHTRQAVGFLVWFSLWMLLIFLSLVMDFTKMTQLGWHLSYEKNVATTHCLFVILFRLPENNFRYVVSFLFLWCKSRVLP